MTNDNKRRKTLNKGGDKNKRADADTGGVDTQMPFNSDTWTRIIADGLERVVNPVEETASGSPVVPPLD
jgi:hypothetical protein